MASWGGKRSGAGRKPGGGIPGTRSLRVEARALLAEIIGTERDPLMVAIEIASDKTKPDPLRLEAALGAARYLHPTLSAQAIATMPGRPEPGSILAEVMNRIAKLAPPPAGPIIDVSAAEKVAS